MDPSEAGLVFCRPEAYAGEDSFYESCAVLRREDPVHRVEAEGFNPFWAITKHLPGVIRAVSRAAVSWGRRGGRINSVSPGLIDTPMGRQEFELQPVMKTM